MPGVVIHGREVPSSAGRPESGGPLSIGVHGGLLHEAPAVMRRDWLPAGATPELDALREQHNALLDRASEVSDARRAVERRFEVEDAEHAEALRAQARGEEVEIPYLTPPQERAAELAPLNAEARAIGQVMEQFVRGAVADITDNYGVWSAAMDEEDANAAARVEEARRALAEAEAALGSRAQLRAWLQRTAGRHPIFKRIDGRHIAYGDLAGVAGPQPERTPEPMLGDSPPTVPAISPEARAQVLADRAARFHGQTDDENGEEA